MPYDHRTIESTWQQRWQAEKVFATPLVQPGDTTAYILDMFPYPSGSGLHVGHLLGYTGSDVLARVARMQGKKVLHPMGWDAFGLPAENYAIKTGVHPALTTERNAAEYKRQISQVGLSYDWEKEMNTSSPEYYRWTQSMFRIMYERGLAYRKEGMVNWCEHDQTVLANEQVVAGRCDRCGNLVIQRNLKQWYFKITDYAERLLNDLDDLEWPEKIKQSQRNWIGRSEGASLTFAVDSSESVIEVYTTRPDTLLGATYVVIAPEHPLVAALTLPEHAASVAAYKESAARKNELERTHLSKEKSGVPTGSMAVHPITKALLPIWIADYVLASYGTGAIMAVPAHDQRDFEFATAFNLPIKQVIQGEHLPVIGKGVLINSAEYTGMDSAEAIPVITAAAGGVLQVRYRLRDWLVSRQRFWGSPIPVVYDEAGAEILLPESQLPVVLPQDIDFVPTGQSPLELATDWKQYTDPETGKIYTREVDTLDTFVCSSWYYLRYPTPHLDTAAFDGEAVKIWLPVDTYIGGSEHAVLHLLYARFFTKVLYDAGLVPCNEPFSKLLNQGMILGPDHAKMSKSKGNIVSPDDVVAQYGADTLRTYELFMGPFDQEKPWSTTSIVGTRRFLDRFYAFIEAADAVEDTPEQLRLVHQLVAKVSQHITETKFNTAIAAMMETLNALEGQSISKGLAGVWVRLLSPFAPHLTEELWQAVLGNSGFCSIAPWPVADPAYLTIDSVIFPIQINGKVRSRIEAAPDATEAFLRPLVMADPSLTSYLAGMTIERFVVVPGRMVAITTKAA